MKSTISQKLKIAKIYLYKFRTLRNFLKQKPNLATSEVNVVNWDSAKLRRGEGFCFGKFFPRLLAPLQM